MVRSPFWNFLVWGASDDMLASGVMEGVVLLVLVDVVVERRERRIRSNFQYSGLAT